MRGPWEKFEIPNHEKFEVPQKFQYGEDPFQCLYLSLPKNRKNVPLVLYFHGGGMTDDNRGYPDAIYDGEYAVVEAKYRLSPRTKAPAQIDDAAMAVAWCFQHADEYGIDKKKIFVGGMSAGAYLAAIVAMNPRFLKPYGLNANSIAGLILCSGQLTTHFQLKKDMGDNRGNYVPVYDEYAPMAHLSKDLPPMLLLTGEPGLDILVRPEENAFVAATLKALGHPFVRYYMLPGHTHGMVLDGGNELIRLFIKDVLDK